MEPSPWITFEAFPERNVVSKFEQSLFPRSFEKDLRPCFITIIGRKTKATLLQRILAVRSPIPAHNQVCLWTSSRFHNGQTAIVVIDSEIQNEVSCSPAPGKSAVATTSWKTPHGRKDFGALLSDRIFAPFSSVICYIASDLGGQRAVARWLARQATARPASDLGNRPRILMVVETTSDIFDEILAESRLLILISEAMREIKEYPDLAQIQLDIDRHFDAVRVLGLKAGMTLSKRTKALKSRLSTLSKYAQSPKRFSLQHFEVLSSQSLEHLCRGSNEPFSFTAASRPHGFSVEGFEHCLIDCLSQMPSQAWLWHVVAPLVASAILLASYPPGAHMFVPRFLFANIFHRACDSAITKYTIHQDIQKKFLTAVLSELESFFRTLESTDVVASKLHRENLEKLQPHLVTFKSHRSCFSCFMRMPEKVLICGHALCDACIKIYGRRSASEKNTFELSECILCGVCYQNSVFRFVPPTAGFRILSLDGGGIRGVIPLIFLQHLQSELAPLECPLRDYFDFVCGTSAGGLVVMGMFLLQWSTIESLERFEKVADKTFGKRKEGATLLTQALQLLMAYIEDGQYSLSAIEESFRRTFNSPIQMFNPLRNDTKVAVTTTTANDSEPVLFTNYNGGKRPESLGYDVVRAKNPQNDVSVSDAACCTAAAPWFFKPHAVDSLGSVFQDGGLHHNNPINIARWETRFLWPDRGDPDFALSIGTGTSSISNNQVKRFYMRLLKSFMRNIDGEEIWIQFKNTLPPESQDRYHRLNLRLGGYEPQLDDVLMISELKNRTLEAINNEPVITEVIDSMIASMFYFELDELPFPSNSGYNCSGYIFCRLDLPPSGRQYLYKRLLETSSWFLIHGCPTVCVETVPQSLPPFKRRVKFSVDTIDEIIGISLRGITRATKPISGFPTTLKGLINALQLNSPFGTIFHSTPEKALPVVPCKRNATDSQYRPRTKRVFAK